MTGGNFAEVENILKQNGVTISQPQQDPVTQNATPENILSQPKQKSSPLERKIKVASAQVKLGAAGESSRKKQGAALIDLAAQNGIEIPNPEVIALTKGSTKAVQKWRDNLMQAEAFKTATPQTQGRGTTEIKTESGTTVFNPPGYTPPQPTLKERAQSVIQKFKARQKAEREADLTNEDDDEEKFIAPNPVRKSEDFDSAEREDDLLLQREDDMGRQEEWAKWKAKQDREPEELQARQAKEKRLREEARRQRQQEPTQPATPEQRNALTTDEGTISQDGINRVKRAIFAKAYGDEGLIARMSESTDDNIRGVTNAFLSAAPLIAKVKAGMQNGTLHNYDLSAINNAAKKLSALRDEGKPVSKYLQEQSLFGEDSAETKEMLSLFDRYKRSPKKIAATLKKIADNIQGQGDPRQESLFGASEPAPLIDLIKRARQEVENEGQAAPLFSKQGEVDTRIENFVDDKDLTPQQKLHKSFGEKLGTKVVFFLGDEKFHGKRENGATYINVNSNKSLGKAMRN